MSKVTAKVSPKLENDEDIVSFVFYLESWNIECWDYRFWQGIPFTNKSWLYVAIVTRDSIRCGEVWWKACMCWEADERLDRKRRGDERKLLWLFLACIHQETSSASWEANPTPCAVRGGIWYVGRSGGDGCGSGRAGRVWVLRVHCWIVVYRSGFWADIKPITTAMRFYIYSAYYLVIFLQLQKLM